MHRGVWKTLVGLVIIRSLSRCLVTGSLHGLWRHLAPCYSSFRSCAAGSVGSGRRTAQTAFWSRPAAGLQCWHRGAGTTHEVFQRGLQHPWKVRYIIYSTWEDSRWSLKTNNISNICLQSELILIIHTPHCQHCFFNRNFSQQGLWIVPKKTSGCQVSQI